MPRLGFGLPLVSSVQESSITLIEDLLWEDIDTNNNISVNYQETRTNSILHSQDATDAEAWTKANTAIDSTLYEAPDNSTTANAIKSDGTGEQVYKITQTSLSVTAGKTYTLSVHVKKENLGFARIKSHDGSTAFRADFNLTTGAVTQTTNTIRTQVDKIDGDWYRCSITFQATATTSSAYVEVFACAASGDSTPNVAVSGVVLLYVWGFQLEENSEPSAYIKTTTSARTATEVLNDFSNVWDFDSADLMPEADPQSEGAWETLDNLVLNGDYEELGSELVTNGTFDADSNWTKGTGWTISGGTAICDGSQSGNAELKQQNGVAGVTLNIVNGKTYELTFDLVVQTGAITQVEIGNTYDTNDITSSGTYTRTLKASSTNKRLTIAGNSTFEGSVDNVTLKQVDPNDRWTLGTGWSIEDGKAVAVATDTAGFSITQSNVLTAGVPHEITFTVSERTAGNVRFRADAVSGTTRSADGTYTEIITPAGHQFAIQGLNSFVGKIDNVTVREYAIQPQDV